MIKVVPYRAEHVMIFQKYSFRQAVEMERSGVSFTAMDENNKVLGCAGVLVPWPRFGMAWMLVSDELLHHPFFMLRRIPRIFEDIKRGFNLRRVELCANANLREHQEYAVWLGFAPEREACARQYTPEGQDAIRYEWVEER